MNIFYKKYNLMIYASHIQEMISYVSSPIGKIL